MSGRGGTYPLPDDPGEVDRLDIEPCALRAAVRAQLPGADRPAGSGPRRRLRHRAVEPRAGRGDAPGWTGRERPPVAGRNPCCVSSSTTTGMLSGKPSAPTQVRSCWSSRASARRAAGRQSAGARARRRAAGPGALGPRAAPLSPGAAHSPGVPVQGFSTPTTTCGWASPRSRCARSTGRAGAAGTSAAPGAPRGSWRAPAGRSGRCWPADRRRGPSPAPAPAPRAGP